MAGLLARSHKTTRTFRFIRRKRAVPSLSLRESRASGEVREKRDLILPWLDSSIRLSFSLPAR